MNKSDEVTKAWCLDCSNKEKSKIRRSEFLIFLRVRHYDLTPCESSIDDREVGVCSECLKSRNHFQQERARPVGDVDLFTEVHK